MEAKRTNAELVLAARHPERGFVLVLGADAKLVVGAGQVKLREKASPASLVDQLINMRQRFHGALSNGVEAAEVLTERQLPSAFRAKTIDAAWEAREGTIHPWSKRTSICWRHSSSSPWERRFIEREQGIG